MRILYFGLLQSGSTSRHRADALIRLGCEVTQYDPFVGLEKSFGGLLGHRLHYHTGYRFLQKAVISWLKDVLCHGSHFDLIWVDGGELFGVAAVQLLKLKYLPIVLFNHDDPTGLRDRRRFFSLLKALPLYDLVTAVRSESESEIRATGVGKVLRIWRTYDEVKHISTVGVAPEFSSDICFIGTWMRNEKRDEFLLELIKRELNVSIWGARWQKSPFWQKLLPYWRGDALSGQDYVSAICGAKVCLGLLSKGNRDLHTTRSMEIPYAGGLLCAERTTDHLQLYKEDVEAVFWSNATECADKCLDLLNDDVRRERIRLAGMKRVRANKVGNEDICRQILQAVGK